MKIIKDKDGNEIHYLGHFTIHPFKIKYFWETFQWDYVREKFVNDNQRVE